MDTKANGRWSDVLSLGIKEEILGTIGLESLSYFVSYIVCIRGNMNNMYNNNNADGRK